MNQPAWISFTGYIRNGQLDPVEDVDVVDRFELIPGYEDSDDLLYFTAGRWVFADGDSEYILMSVSHAPLPGNNREATSCH